MFAGAVHILEADFSYCICAAPSGLDSSLKSDYSIGREIERISPLQIEILQDILRDQGLGDEQIQSRFATLESSLLTPDNLMRLLNHYMSVMVDVIVLNGGIINKFGGDSLLAFFGTPLNPLPNHAARAVQSALDMREALENFNREQDIENVPPLEIGIGIATGLVVAGNIGGKERIEYTVIGDTVNLASRLQNMTKEFKYEILINDTTHKSAVRVIGYESIRMPAIEVRGRQTRVDIYAMR